MSQSYSTQACPACNKPVMVNSSKCPHCGHPLNQQQPVSREQFTHMVLFGLGVLALVGFCLLAWKGHEAKVAEDSRPPMQDDRSTRSAHQVFTDNAPAKPAEPTTPARTGKLVLNEGWRLSVGQFGDCDVSGIVTNDSDYTSYRYVQITFKIKDRDGNVVGNAWGNITNLGPGENWKFKAVAFAQGAATASFSELSGH